MQACYIPSHRPHRNVTNRRHSRRIGFQSPTAWCRAIRSRFPRPLARRLRGAARREITPPRPLATPPATKATLGGDRQRQSRWPLSPGRLNCLQRRNPHGSGDHGPGLGARQPWLATSGSSGWIFVNTRGRAAMDRCWTQSPPTTPQKRRHFPFFSHITTIHLPAIQHAARRVPIEPQERRGREGGWGEMARCHRNREISAKTSGITETERAPIRDFPRRRAIDTVVAGAAGGV